MNRRQAIRVKQRYSDRLLEHREVAGVGVGSGAEPGSFQIVVFLKSDPTPELRTRIAADLEGNPFEFITTGPFKLQPAFGPIPFPLE